MKKKMTILITGANGFVGRALLQELQLFKGCLSVKIISRSVKSDGLMHLNFDDFIANKFDLSFFSEIDTVIHLAGVAHNFGEVDTRSMAMVGHDQLVKILDLLDLNKLEKVIFLSSYSVSLLNKKIILDTKEYAEEKLKIEKYIIDFAMKKFHKTKFYILRPPMVYGKNAPGNFNKLISLLQWPILLPLGSFDNKRNFIHVRNLCSFISYLTLNKVNDSDLNILEIADPWDETLISFISRLNKRINKKCVIVPLPKFIVMFIFKLLNKYEIYKKLSLNFSIDYKQISLVYDWKPPVTKDESFLDLTFRK